MDAVLLDTIRTHGGLPGLRDENALEPALARPRNRWVYGRTRNLATLAVAIFLEVNGYQIDAPEAEIVTVFVNLAAGRMSENALAKWIRGQIVPVSSA